MLLYLLARAREPSSYAGLAALLGVLGVNLTADQWQAVVAAITAIAAAVAVFVPEKGSGSGPAPSAPPGDQGH